MASLSLPWCAGDKYFADAGKYFGYKYFFFVILDVVEPPIFASPFLVFCIFLNVRWMLFAVRVDELVATREARGRHSENLD